MRVLIASDEEGVWYVRRVCSVEHDLATDQKVYRCDGPIGASFYSLVDACYSALAYLKKQPDAA